MCWTHVTPSLPWTPGLLWGHVQRLPHCVEVPRPEALCSASVGLGKMLTLGWGPGGGNGQSLLLEPRSSADPAC